MSRNPLGGLSVAVPVPRHSTEVAGAAPPSARSRTTITPRPANRCRRIGGGRLGPGPGGAYRSSSMTATPQVTSGPEGRSGPIGPHLDAVVDPTCDVPVVGRALPDRRRRQAEGLDRAGP